MRPPEAFTSRPAAPADAADVAELMMAFDRAYLEEPDVIDECANVTGLVRIAKALHAVADVLIAQAGE